MNASGKNAVSANKRSLLWTILLSVALCLIGITWGRVEEWHPDQMAFRDMFHGGAPPFHPQWFLRPPLYTYINYFLSVLPVDLISRGWSIPVRSLLSYRLVWSRLLVVGMFIGSGLWTYGIVKRITDIITARRTLMIFLTSAGLITLAHFLTSDISLLFWMSLDAYVLFQSFRTKRMMLLVPAGFITGLAAATKYDGSIGIIAVCITYVALSAYSVRNAINNMYWLIGAFVSAAGGFIVGNPYAVLDHKFFINDFLYLVETDKLYYLSKRTSPLPVVSSVTEAIGVPMAMVIIVGLVLVCRKLWKKQCSAEQKFVYLMSFSVIVPNIVFVTGYPSVPMRYVIPTIPFLFLIGSYTLFHYARRTWLVYVTALVVIYNIVCSVYVGIRFYTDPRMTAQLWVMQHVAKGETIENYYYSPSWDLLPNSAYHVSTAPYLSGRNRRFKRILQAAPPLAKRLQEVDQDRNDTVSWYSFAGLTARSPDYVAIDSLIFDRFIFDTPAKAYYPEVSAYYGSLLKGEYPYHVVFDHASLPPVPILYPHTIDVVDNRLVILQKNAY